MAAPHYLPVQFQISAPRKNPFSKLLIQQRTSYWRLFPELDANCSCQAEAKSYRQLKFAAIHSSLNMSHQIQWLFLFSLAFVLGYCSKNVATVRFVAGTLLFCKPNLNYGCDYVFAGNMSIGSTWKSFNYSDPNSISPVVHFESVNLTDTVFIEVIVFGHKGEVNRQFTYRGKLWASSEYIFQNATSSRTQDKFQVIFDVTCKQDFYGALCDTECKPSADSPVHYHCSSDGRIVCRPDWIGAGCKTFNYCRAFPCEHGSCENVPHLQYRFCNCENSGYTGIDCHINIDECSLPDRTVCPNYANCQDTMGSFTCKCVPPFYGADCSACNRSAVDGDLCNNFMVRLLGENTLLVQVAVLVFSGGTKALLLAFIISLVYRQRQRKRRRSRRIRPPSHDIDFLLQVETMTRNKNEKLASAAAKTENSEVADKSSNVCDLQRSSIPDPPVTESEEKNSDDCKEDGSDRQSVVLATETVDSEE